MAAISDSLDLEHFDCAAGSTVERPFLEAIATALGLDGSRQSYSSKELLLAALLRRVGTEDPEPFLSSGGTVTDKALAQILEGIVRSGLATTDLVRGAAAARIALARFDNGSGEEVFDALELSDERRRALRLVTVRDGASRFRSAMMNAYGGRCAVSGCDVPEALEAAHIRPYSGPRSNAVPNGILLRADLHRLWDTGLLAVAESGYQVLLAEHLVSTDYSLFGGQRITLPAKPEQVPSSAALEQQRLWAGL